jgi:hypothetical protein
MNQTGVYGTGCRRHARMNGESITGFVVGTKGSSHNVLTGPTFSPATRRDTPCEIPGIGGASCQDQPRSRLRGTARGFVAMTSELYRDCPECDEDRLFEQPHLTDCPDTPDGECPEWACVACGTAVLADFPLPVPAQSSRRRAA